MIQLMRKQLLLPRFCINFIHNYCKDQFGFNFSEAVRVKLMLSIGAMIQVRYPKVKYKFTYKYMNKLCDKNEKYTKEMKKELINEISFETQRVIHYMESL